MLQDWIDVSNYSGELSDAMVACLNRAGVAGVIVRGSLETQEKLQLAQRQLQAVTDGGLLCAVYAWCYASWDPRRTMQQTILAFSEWTPVFYAPDFEDVESFAALSPEEGAGWIAAAMDELGVVRQQQAILYTSEECWIQMTGNATSLPDWPVWDAWYTGERALGGHGYGPFTRFVARQYGAAAVCVPNADADVFDSAIMPMPAPSGPDIASVLGRAAQIRLLAEQILEADQNLVEDASG